jgi:hypothetical protein
MNSFAENKLPAATRIRYLSHLADCSDCRRLATKLSGAAEVSRERPKSEIERSFWNNVRAFFSPVVLRYAMPALTILVFAAIGLFVYREQQRNEFVAQKTNTEGTPVSISGESKNQAEPATSGVPRESVVSQSTSTPAAEVDKSKTNTTTSAGSRAQSGAAASTEDQKNEPAPARPQAAYAPEPSVESPPPSAKTEAADESRVTREREEKARDADRRADPRQVDEAGAVAGRSSAQNVPAARAGSVASEQNEVAFAKEKQAKRSDEIRSVGGRQFRREGNGWVDTKYDPDRAIVIVRRGSEQYRALIADEPQLRTIAESLSGTVVVVWKGRAYRFQ